MRRSCTTRIALSLTLLLPACAAEPDQETAGGAVAAAAPDTTRMYMVRLDGRRSPQMVGSAGFVPDGEGTLVIAGLRGATAGGTLRGHIHQGESCDAPGSPRHPLGEIRAGTDGIGRARTVLPATIGSVFDGRHLIVYQAEGESPGDAVFCGDIPILVPLTEDASPQGV